jgi:hypothetical protein
LAEAKLSETEVKFFLVRNKTQGVVCLFLFETKQQISGAKENE